MDKKSLDLLKAEAKRRRLYQTVFNTPEGQEVLHDMMYHHKFVTPTLAKSPLLMAFNEGQRNVMLRVLSILKKDIGEIEQIIEEGEHGSKKTRLGAKATITV